MTTSAGVCALVEFAGLPGAGKSTVAESTHRALLAAGVESHVSDAGISASVPLATRAFHRLVLAGTQASRHPLRGMGAIRAIHEVAPGSLRDAVAGTVQLLAVRRLEALADRTPGVHLLQEGTVQTAWTLALRSHGRHDALSCHLPQRPTGDPRPGTVVRHLLVVVDAPLDVVSARLETRSSRHSRTQLLTERARSAELLAGHELMREIVCASDCPQLSLVNDGVLSPEELGGRVAEWVLRAGT